MPAGLRDRRCALFAYVLLCVLLPSAQALAHGVSEDDAERLLGGSGPRPAAFLYLGAKHMVTGYDHLLYLAGVVFFLRGFGQVATYVTLFALGTRSP